MKGAMPFVWKFLGLTAFGLVLTYGPGLVCYHLINPQAPNDRLLAGLSWSDPDEVALAFARGASPEAAEPHSGRTALMIASSMGDVSYTRQLLEKGASVHARDRYGRSALAHAARTGQDDTVRELIRAGANLEDRDSYGMTPLAHAAYNGQISMVYLLIQFGASVDPVDVDGATPLMYAAACGEASPVVGMLLDAGANPARADRDGRTALDHAIQAQQTDAIERLRDRPHG